MFKFLTSRKGKRAPGLPKGVRIYAIGDVHGCLDLLQDVCKRIDADIKTHQPVRPIQVFLGDYIDRGPKSREVLECLIWRGRVHESVFLKGNHETYVSSFLQNPTLLSEWRHWGGLETLMSYGLKPSLNPSAVEQTKLAASFEKALPDAHRKFLANLDLYFSCGDFFFVHAGVRPGVPLNRQREEDLIWIREDFLLCEERFGKIIIHGHTPVREPEFHPNRINIDTGAYATGQLTCLIIEQNAFQIL